MTLKQLEAFYWAANCASFAVAAQRLHLSVSSLSKRIAELEQSLGQTLFDRSGQRAALTAVGAELLPRAGALLDQAASLRAELGRRPALRGTCRFGVGELTASTWLPALVARLQAAHPALHPAPSVDIGAVLEQQVAAGELDFAIVAGRSLHGSVASRPLGEAHFSWCCAPVRSGRKRTLSPQLLAQGPLVTLPAGAGTTRLLDDFLAASGLDSGPRITCNQWSAVAGLLAEGVGIGFLPEAWARALEQRGTLRRLASTPPLGTLGYAFLHRRDDHRPLIQTMSDLCAATADFSRGHLLG
ncbi:LysR family transcriptional regulator [Aquabacterium sp.]|uniref:LysR family transcriptional regulator n=1 Tax=Aquabacterium sp. TaxID=1872578 RepID=UPI0037852341